MSRLFNLGMLFFLAAAFLGCEEVGPYIELKPANVDSSYISAEMDDPQQKNVLIEDFTGVKCPNCPNAAAKIEELMTTYPNRIIAAGIHVTNLFGTPHPNSKEDYRLEAGRLIYTSILNGKNVLPMGAIDRVKYPAEEEILTQYNTWASYVSQRLSLTTPVNINLPFIELSDTIITFRVLLHYTQSVTDTHAFSVYLIENNIIDPQTLPDNSIDDDYVHKHILRSVITPINGIDLKDPLSLNRVFVKTFKININPKWKIDNCKVIVFVHKKGYLLDVVHAEEFNLK